MSCVDSILSLSCFRRNSLISDKLIRQLRWMTYISLFATALKQLFINRQWQQKDISTSHSLGHFQIYSQSGLELRADTTLPEVFISPPSFVLSLFKSLRFNFKVPLYCFRPFLLTIVEFSIRLGALIAKSNWCKHK